VIDVADSSGKPLFRAFTEVDFSEALGGTRMDLVQTYTLIDPSMAWMWRVPDGWRTTLDKLEKEVVRLHGGTDTGIRSVAHDTFHLERLRQDNTCDQVCGDIFARFTSCTHDRPLRWAARGAKTSRLNGPSRGLRSRRASDALTLPLPRSAQGTNS
jgi:hypothetical protein